MDRPWLTQREAAQACGVSRSTIRRRREAGDLPDSRRDAQRGWLIPVDDLLAAGLRLHAPAPAESEAATPAGPPGPAATVSATAGSEPAGEAGEAGARVADLIARLERERHRSALAEAEARHLAARLADRTTHVEDLRRALRALSPAPAPAPTGGDAASPAGPTEPSGRVHGHTPAAHGPGPSTPLSTAPAVSPAGPATPLLTAPSAHGATPATASPVVTGTPPVPTAIPAPAAGPSAPVAVHAVAPTASRPVLDTPGVEAPRGGAFIRRLRWPFRRKPQETPARPVQGAS
ncbi:helix-turn-helix domain-containing protein [Streptomyces sp. NPDC050560]|uniref:helix-turn-helix domain-containing protein n=1 Tax=Streptomyces sp. NPDC050560 TaxID=3365630 RepID=UPI0037A12F87